MQYKYSKIYYPHHYRIEKNRILCEQSKYIHISDIKIKRAEHRQQKTCRKDSQTTFLCYNKSAGRLFSVRTQSVFLVSSGSVWSGLVEAEPLGLVQQLGVGSVRGDKVKGRTNRVL